MNPNGEVVAAAVFVVFVMFVYTLMFDRRDTYSVLVIMFMLVFGFLIMDANTGFKFCAAFFHPPITASATER